MNERAAAVVVAFTTAAALTLLCVRGFYIRWFSDDFLVPACVARIGFWRGQGQWYREWSGRFTFNFADALMAAIGPRTSIILVLLVAIVLLLALHANLRRWPLALAIAWAVLLGTSDVPQSILWKTGLLSYAVPFAAFAWWISNAAGRTEWRWFDAVVPLLAGGCSETQVLAQIVICATAFAAWRRKPIVAGLVASIVCVGIIALSPGNAMRQARVGPTPPFMHAIAMTAADTASFFADAVTRTGLMLLLVFLAAALWAPRMPRRVVAATLLCAAGCVVVSLGAGELLLAAPLPERARLIAYALIVAGVTALGASLPWPQRFRPALTIAVVILAIVPVISAVQIAREIPDARAFAGRWDRFEAFLRRNRGRDVVVYDAPGSIGTLRFLNHDPMQNDAITTIYHLHSLGAMPLQRNGRIVAAPLANAVSYRFE